MTSEELHHWFWRALTDASKSARDGGLVEELAGYEYLLKGLDSGHHALIEWHDNVQDAPEGKVFLVATGTKVCLGFRGVVDSTQWKEPNGAPLSNVDAYAELPGPPRGKL